MHRAIIVSGIYPPLVSGQKFHTVSLVNYGKTANLLRRQVFVFIHEIASLMTSGTRIIQILALGFALLLPSFSYAQPKDECPKRLGIVINDRLSNYIATILSGIYEDLGCPIELIDLPGRRGFVAFNNGRIDGELFRLPVGAAHYTKPYVRSDIPLIAVTSSLWGMPGSKLHSDDTIGYTIGIAWQEDYLNKNMLRKSGHNDVDDIIQHYNSGTFDRFLAEDSTIDLMITEGAFAKDRIPVRIELLEDGPLYHFLAAEFSPFMERFSNYLSEHQPFAKNGMM
ncbi:hypothetical protein [Thalassospira sp.]|uniref:hypothetical protein n=1 Tax=Thalassospira sp. TaxID=1912094 RepID=UPI001B048416|nr:hypothetical protein [Thalassospira sp.]MBO6808499.1 hypothetical protein [Thalassospira sp.]MBO6839803.1 hypothetical protein [Thalassospira sp.]